MHKPIGLGFVQGTPEDPFTDSFQHYGSRQIGAHGTATANHPTQQGTYSDMTAGLGLDFSVHKRGKAHLIPDPEDSDTVMAGMTHVSSLISIPPLPISSPPQSFSEHRADKYPAFSAEHAVFNSAEPAHDSTANNFASTSSRIPSNVQKALADLHEKTGFSIVPTKSKYNGEDGHNSSRHMGGENQGGNLATDIEEDRFTRHHSGPITGFTPLVKQLEEFGQLQPRKSKSPEPEPESASQYDDSSDSDSDDTDTNADANSATEIDTDVDTHVEEIVPQPNAYNIPVRALHYLKAKTLKDFAKFKKLPLELQLIIWTIALPGPRTVEIYCKRYDFGVSEHVALYPVCYRPPGMLYACSLSRRLALKTMSLHFAPPFLSHPGIFFSTSLDTLRLDLPSGQDLAHVNDASISTSRSLVRNVELVFHLKHELNMYESIADLVLRAPHCSWPAVEMWRFPGVDAEEDFAEEVSFAVVEFNRTEDLDGNQDALQEKRELLARFIDEAVRHEQEVVDEETRVGVFVRYI